jgi:hypothetical protein
VPPPGSTAATSDDAVQQIKARVDLVDVVSEHVRLARRGGRLTGLCPFHEEKTPSFVVNDAKGFYHCFGCGAHGDAIRFLIDARQLTFAQAVRKLAAMAGIPLPTDEVSAKSATIRLENPMAGTKKGGAKLSRSETVTVRLDPKLNYLCDLAARAQRRTKSSFIEWAIADSLKHVQLPEVPYDQRDFEGDDPTVQEKASQLWHVDEPDRVAALAIIAPALLTHEEQLIWRLVRENGLIWKGQFDKHDEWKWTVSEQSLIRDRLRDHWETFKGVALGDLPSEKLPTWQKHRTKQTASFDTDLDDDVPF